MLTHGTNPHQVALTFDDGPSGWTGPLLRVLSDHGARATFFVLGQHIIHWPMTMESIKREVHELGNHSMNHLCLGDQPYDVVEQEILDGDEAMGKCSDLFRPPYGRIAPTPVDKIAESMGYRVVGWYGRPAGDWAASSANAIASHVLDQIVQAASDGISPIILLHDGGPKGGEDRSLTVEAVDMILRMSPERQFVTVSQLEGLQ